MGAHVSNPESRRNTEVPCDASREEAGRAEQMDGMRGDRLCGLRELRVRLPPRRGFRGLCTEYTPLPLRGVPPLGGGR